MPPVAIVKSDVGMIKSEVPTVKAGDVPTEEDIRKLNEAALVCSLENKEACMMCSSQTYFQATSKQLCLQQFKQLF